MVLSIIVWPSSQYNRRQAPYPKGPRFAYIFRAFLFDSAVLRILAVPEADFRRAINAQNPKGPAPKGA